MNAPGSLAQGLREAGFRGGLEAEASLAPFTTWRIGGPAECLATPADRDDLLLALGWAAERATPWRVLGNGSNLLVADSGVRGLVLRLRRVLSEVTVEAGSLTAGAGASFPVAARRAAGAGLSGIEFGAGIPGTIGGAIVMNAGWHQYEIGNHVASVEFVEPPGRVRRFGHADCRFEYRGSFFRGRPGVVLSAELHLAPGNPEQIARTLEGFAESRKRNQPTELPSCGSVFLKPEGDFAGRLIDSAGLKGLRVGDIAVSDKHANFFVNLGQATAADVLALVERVEGEVLRLHGVRLVREFEAW